MAKNRNQNLDALKGVAILLVMLGHCIVLNQMEDGIIYDAIKSIQMPMFMIASGFTVGMVKRIGNMQLLANKISKRAIAYLVPFFSWLLILHWNQLPKIIIAILFQLDRGLWFLMVLFILTTIMYLALAVRDMTPLKTPGFFMVWGIASALILYQYRSGNTFLSPHLTVYYMPFYFLGYILYQCYRFHDIQMWRKGKGIRKTEPTKRDRIIMLASAFAACCVFAVLIVQKDMIIAANTFELLLQMTASLCGCYLCIILVRMLPDGKVKKGLAFVGNYTLEIYVIHYHFAQILGMADKNLSLYTLQGAGVILLTFLIMCVLTAVSIWLLKQLWITDLLLFGKRKARLLKWQNQSQIES